MKKKLILVRSAILVFLTHRVALPVVKLIRQPNTFLYNREELAQFPRGTLGKDLFLFLDERNLPLLKHYARHDLKHVLLNYDTTDEGEACLQCFMLGNGRISFPVIATFIFGFVTMPEHWGKMKRAYREGKKSKSFHHWPWNELLYQPTDQLRNKIFHHH